MIDTPFLAQAHRDAHNAPLGLRSRPTTPTRADNIMWRVIVPGAALFTVLAAIGLRLVP